MYFCDTYESLFMRERHVRLVNVSSQWCAEARVSVDLLNHWVAEFGWYRPGSSKPSGQSHEVLFSESDARARLEIFVSTRKRCGYVEQHS